MLLQMTITMRSKKERELGVHQLGHVISTVTEMLGRQAELEETPVFCFLIYFKIGFSFQIWIVQTQGHMDSANRFSHLLSILFFMNYI